MLFVLIAYYFIYFNFKFVVYRNINFKTTCAKYIKQLTSQQKVSQAFSVFKCFTL